MLVIEGIDTAGKSTQLELFEKKFSKCNFTKEPGGTLFRNKTKSNGFLGGEAKSQMLQRCFIFS